MDAKQEKQLQELYQQYQEKAVEIIEIKELLRQLNTKLRDSQETLSNIKYCIEFLNH